MLALTLRLWFMGKEFMSQQLLSDFDSQSACKRLLERCDLLAGFSALKDGILRAYLTPEHQLANQQVADWMNAAGMSTWQDQVGNVWGRYEGNLPKAPALILGSHLDTVPYAGRYDGILGVLSAIELVSELNEKHIRFDHAIEIVGFCDEEGTRFGTTLIGSKALAGLWQDDWLSVTDEDGISMAQALKNFGLDPEQCANAKLNSEKVLGFWELHIEQGPVLEAEDLPVGIVTGIAGARRASIQLKGQAGHAGTTPMNLRRDSLCGAAEITLAIEKIANSVGGDLVATVGQMFTKPGAVNVISGQTLLSLDVRSQNDQLRDQVIETINDTSEVIAGRRNLELSWSHTHRAAAVMCEQSFQEVFAQAIDTVFMSRLPIRYLPSGAGHDAMAMAEICPMAMLFLRSPRGLSHHPDESVIPEDVNAALRVFFQSLTIYMTGITSE